MTTTQYNSNNSLTPEFKWTSFEERNNLDELIHIPINAEEGFVIQISFKRHNPEAASKITADPRSTVFSKSAKPGDLPHKFIILALFLRPNRSIRKPVHPLLLRKGFSTLRQIFIEEANFTKLKLITYYIRIKLRTEVTGSIVWPHNMILMNEEKNRHTENSFRILIAYQISECLDRFISGFFRECIINAVFQDVHHPITVCEKYFTGPWKRRFSLEQTINDQILIKVHDIKGR